MGALVGISGMIGGIIDFGLRIEAILSNLVGVSVAT